MNGAHLICESRFLSIGNLANIWEDWVEFSLE